MTVDIKDPLCSDIFTLYAVDTLFSSNKIISHVSVSWIYYLNVWMHSIGIQPAEIQIMIITVWKLTLAHAEAPTRVMTESSLSPLYEPPGYSLTLPAGSVSVDATESSYDLLSFSCVSINWFCCLTRERLSDPHYCLQYFHLQMKKRSPRGALRSHSLKHMCCYLG